MQTDELPVNSEPEDAPWSSDEDIIGNFIRGTEQAFSPLLFRRWAAIGMVAGALERRVWASTKGGKLYPNLYTLLVAPPGVGKYVIEMVNEEWKGLKDGSQKLVHVAPSSMTKASLIDELARCKTARLPPKGEPVEYASLLVAAEELPVLLPSYDTEYLGVLNKIYNNPSDHSETRRTGSVKEIEIRNPQLNILAAVQPGWLASTFPEEAWSTGLTSRMVMIYSSETQVKPLFGEDEKDYDSERRMRSGLRECLSLFGEARWTPDAQRRLESWHLAGGPPSPTHSKLENYVRRRTIHVVKLSLVSAVSRARSLIIEKVDVDRALTWLFEAEGLMPDIFRAMIGKSDKDVLEELHIYLTSVWKTNKMKPFHLSTIYRFLTQRVPTDKVKALIESAERASIIIRVGGTEDMYTPGALQNGIVE